MNLRKPIEDGVKAGLKSAFSPGGALTKALNASLAPIFDELRRLRRLERRLRWHPIEQAPEWLKDGRAVLVNQAGDLRWACWSQEDGEEGYWDADVEYGGEPLDPQPSHFFLVPDAPASSGEAVAAGQLREAPSPPPIPQGEEP